MAPTQSCAAAPAPSPSESDHGTRWSPSAALRPARQQAPRLAARVTAADRQARTPGGPAATKQVSFSDPLVSSPSSSWRRHATVPEPFSYPVRRFLCARDQQRRHSYHRRGTHPVNGHCPRGWTSDLFSSQPEFGGQPCEELPTPLETVKPVRRTLVNLYSAVYKPPVVC
jgi:hypothetical protein